MWHKIRVRGMDLSRHAGGSSKIKEMLSHDVRKTSYQPEVSGVRVK